MYTARCFLNSLTSNNLWNLLTNGNIDVSMQWVPGHKNVAGNEKADIAAKEATKLDQSLVPIDLQTAKSATRRWMRDECKKDWRVIDDSLKANTKDEETLKKAHYVKCMNPAKCKDSGSATKKKTPSLSRRDEVLIYQLRLGKSPIVRSCLATYDNQRGDKQFCKNEGCVNVKENVEHLLIKCPTYSKERCICFEDGFNVTLNVLDKDPEAVIRYMKMIGRDSTPEL